MPHPQAAAGLDKLEHVAARRKLHDNRQVVLRKEDLLELDDAAAGAVWSGSALMLDSAQVHDYAFRQQALPTRAARELHRNKVQPFSVGKQVHAASLSMVGGVLWLQV